MSSILPPDSNGNKTHPRESESLDFDESATLSDIVRLSSRAILKAQVAGERVVLAKYLLKAMSGLEGSPYYMNTFSFLVEQERERRAAEETNARCVIVIQAAYGDR